VKPRRRHHGGKPGDEVDAAEDDGGGPIPKRPLEAVAKPAIGEALEPAKLEGRTGEIAAQSEDRLPAWGLDRVVTEDLKALRLGDLLAPGRQRAGGGLVDAAEQGLAGTLAEGLPAKHGGCVTLGEQGL
jgi:hypothetical protein